ncbi:MAG: hypothetical protein R3Y13_01700 [bacterium]
MNDILNGIKFFLDSLTLNNYALFCCIIGIFMLIIVLVHYTFNQEPEKNELSDLEAISKELMKGQKPVTIEFTEFEIMQEKEAIISYSELKTKTILEQTQKFQDDFRDEIAKELSKY